MNTLVAAFYEVRQVLVKARINPSDVTIVVPERAIRNLEDEKLVLRDLRGQATHGTIVGINYIIKRES